MLIPQIINSLKRRLSPESNSVSESIIYKLLPDELILDYTSSILFDYKYISSKTELNNLPNLENEKYSIFSNKIKNGEIGIFALSNNDIMGYAWGKQYAVDHPLNNQLLSLSEYEAYIYHCHTIERFRGKNIYPRLLSLLSEKLFKAGTRVIYVDTSPSNILDLLHFDGHPKKS